MNADFGSFIKKRRKEKGLTQKELASKLSISDKAVSKWEVGDSYPDISLLLSIAEIFEITVDELLTCEIHPKENPKETTKKLLLFNIGANIVLIIVILVFMFMTLLGSSASSFEVESLTFSIDDNEQYMVTTFLILFFVTVAFSIYNLLQYKKLRGDINEEISTM